MTNLNIQRIKEKAKRDKYDKIKDEVDNILMLYIPTVKRRNKNEMDAFAIKFSLSLIEYYYKADDNFLWEHFKANVINFIDKIRIKNKDIFFIQKTNLLRSCVKILKLLDNNYKCTFNILHI